MLTGGVLLIPNITLKNYVIQRIESIKHHPRKINENGKSSGLYPTITFQDLYEHLQIDMDTTVTPKTEKPLLCSGILCCSYKCMTNLSYNGFETPYKQF